MDDNLKLASADPFSFPLWFLIHPEKFASSGGDLQASMPFLETLEREKFAPLFTDRDLALRLIEEDNLAGLEPMPVEDFKQLCAMLVLFRRGGVEYVGTDFSSKRFGQSERTGQLRTIAHFLGESGAGNLH